MALHHPPTTAHLGKMYDSRYGKSRKENAIATRILRKIGFSSHP